ncbi:MAG TPA: ABC transporter, partial [Halieaceae bacterium]|nr:ABC transporter [Halieaceae bacterium]
LLRRLHREVFIFDAVDELPDVVEIEGFGVRRVDERTLEIEVEKGQHINEVFAGLSQADIRISSMRNRANRLEEMFVRLVEGAQ